MNSFKIPTNKLKLFLKALEMNFQIKEPDYIFQVPDGFEIVYLKGLDHPWQVRDIEFFVDKLWNGHSGPCDLDANTLHVLNYNRGIWKTCDKCRDKLNKMREEKNEKRRQDLKDERSGGDTC